MDEKVIIDLLISELQKLKIEKFEVTTPMKSTTDGSSISIGHTGEVYIQIRGYYKNHKIEL